MLEATPGAPNTLYRAPPSFSVPSYTGEQGVVPTYPPQAHCGRRRSATGRRRGRRCHQTGRPLAKSPGTVRCPRSRSRGRLDFGRACLGYDQGMDGRITLRDDDIEGTLATLRRLSSSCEGDLGAVREQLSELRRNARRHVCKNADRKPSDDEIKYRLGSVLHVLGASAADPVALLGLLYHTDVALGWLARARGASGAPPLFDLIADVFGDPERLDWCRRWGMAISWERSRALYQAEVESFLASGKADDPRARWRKKPATANQIYLIAQICELRSVPAPPALNRGEAFDWIRREGGNPRYWAPPHGPPPWPPSERPGDANPGPVETRGD